MTGKGDERAARRRAGFVLLGSAVGAALVLALVEVTRQVAAGDLLRTGADVFRFTVFNLTLYLAAGLLLGGLEVLLLLALPSRLDPGRLAAAARAWWAGQHPAGYAITGGLLGCLGGGALFALVAYRSARYFMESFADRQLAALALSGVLLGALLACGLAGLVLARLGAALLARVARRAPGVAAPRTVVLGLVVLGLGAVAVVAVSQATRLAGAELDPVLFGGAFLLLHLLLAYLLAGVPLDRLTRHGAVRWGWPLAVLALLSAVAFTLFRLGDQPRIKHLTTDRTVATRELIRLFQRGLDRDGDGYAALLGGEDCDESDPAVHPGAVEVPNNGVDEDCSGEDLRIASFGEEEPPDGALPEELVPPPGLLRDEPAQRLVLDSARLEEAAPRIQIPERPDLLLITVDALRADRLGPAGYHRALTPNLDRLAAHGVWFASAHSQAPMTVESFGSLLTSRYPTEVAWGSKRYVPLLPANVTVAEVLRASGYATGAVITHSYFLPEYGFGQGFEHWDTSLVSRVNSVAFGQTTSPQLTDKAIAWLAETASDERPRFLWVHYFDPHDHYVFHPGTPKFGTRPVDRYDHEILFTDRYLGQLLDYVWSSPRGQNTIVALCGDHGEAFGEHGYTLHGRHLFADQIHVPLVLAGAGVPAGRQVSAPVGLIDLAPTLIRLAGARPPVDFRGRDLRRHLAPGAGGEAVVYSEFLGTRRRGPKKAMVAGDWKLIFDLREQLYFLYDLRSDPTEQRNLYAIETRRGREMRRALTRWIATELDSRLVLAR